MKGRWPFSGPYSKRFHVEDLLPGGGSQGLRAVFIGESPHRDEVASEDPLERSPFRGVAGREWWLELGRFGPGPPTGKAVPARLGLERLCAGLGVAVMNAVPYPIDPKIKLHQGEGADPFRNLGFEKSSGPRGYRAVYRAQGSPVERAIEDLARRLDHPAFARAQWVCLGHDSRWFVEKALAKLGGERSLETVPHPSSWWRSSAYRARAVATLERLLVRQRSLARKSA